MIQHEWNAQKTDNAFLGKALPDDAYFSAIDHARKMSKAAGAQRKARGVKAGLPDWLIVWHGITLWIERKVDASLSEGQKTTRDALRANGHHWALAKSLEDVEAACRDVGIPLKATLGDIRERIAAQDYVPPKKRAPANRKVAEPRFQWGKSATKRAAARGVLV
jgi:hypothetical protein